MIALKYSLLIVFSSYFGSIVFAKTEGIPLGKFDVSIYNEILNKQIDSNLTLETTTGNYTKSKAGEVMLCSNETLVSVCFDLNAKERATLRSLLNKFLEWEKKAKEKNDSFEKSAGKLVLRKASFTTNREWYFSFDSYSIEAGFFTRIQKGFFGTEKDYQFTLSFPKIFSSNNKFISHAPATLYFTTVQAESFRKEIEEEALRVKVNLFYEKQKKLKTDYK